MKGVKFYRRRLPEHIAEFYLNTRVTVGFKEA